MRSPPQQARDFFRPEDLTRAFADPRPHGREICSHPRENRFRFTSAVASAVTSTVRRTVPRRSRARRVRADGEVPHGQRCDAASLPSITLRPEATRTAPADRPWLRRSNPGVDDGTCPAARVPVCRVALRRRTFKRRGGPVSAGWSAAAQPQRRHETSEPGGH